MKCGKDLTNEDVYFDSRLRKRKLEILKTKGLTEDDITYGWCQDCYKTEISKIKIKKMYYRIDTQEGRFNLLDPSEERVSNWIGIYDGDELIKAASLLSESQIFSDDDTPEEIADTLENELSRIIYSSEEEDIRDVINFLRENAKELRKGKLLKDIEDTEQKIEELQRLKEKLFSELRNIENDIKS